MVSLDTYPATIAPHLLSSNHAPIPFLPSSPEPVSSLHSPHHLLADFNYYEDPGDGSAPSAAIVGKPETYKKPTATKKMPVHDMRGEEERYTLDKNGFEIVRHESGEKEFRDEERITKEYYAEVEEILKKAYVPFCGFPRLLAWRPEDSFVSRSRALASPPSYQ